MPDILGETVEQYRGMTFALTKRPLPERWRLAEKNQRGPDNAPEIMALLMAEDDTALAAELKRRGVRYLLIDRNVVPAGLTWKHGVSEKTDLRPVLSRMATGRELENFAPDVIATDWLLYRRQRERPRLTPEEQRELVARARKCLAAEDAGPVPHWLARPHLTQLALTVRLAGKRLSWPSATAQSMHAALQTACERLTADWEKTYTAQHGPLAQMLGKLNLQIDIVYAEFRFHRANATLINEFIEPGLHGVSLSRQWHVDQSGTENETLYYYMLPEVGILRRAPDAFQIVRQLCTETKLGDNCWTNPFVNAGGFLTLMIFERSPQGPVTTPFRFSMGTPTGDGGALRRAIAEAENYLQRTGSEFPDTLTTPAPVHLPGPRFDAPQRTPFPDYAGARVPAAGVPDFADFAGDPIALLRLQALPEFHDGLIQDLDRDRGGVFASLTDRRVNAARTAKALQVWREAMARISTNP